MLLIVSEEEDISTDNVVEWCHHHKVPFIRINDRECVNILSNILLDEEDLQVQIEIKGRSYMLSDISSVWFRRGNLYHISDIELDALGSKAVTNPSLLRFMENENRTLNDFLISALRSKFCVGNPAIHNANKLIALEMAKRAGFKIPKTWIITNSADLKAKFNGTRIITKAIQDALWVEEEDGDLIPSACSVSPAFIENDTRFYYSLFQAEIEKQYELRIFFIGYTVFASAIFPRNSVNIKDVPEGSDPPRIIPYKLELPEIDKLMQFAKLMNLETGSVDIIVDPKDNFYFLEVNPVGQYDYISKICNYYIDDKIAMYFFNQYQYGK